MKIVKFNNKIDTIVDYSRYKMIMSKENKDSFIDHEYILNELNLSKGDSLNKDTGTTCFYYKRKIDTIWLKHCYTVDGKIYEK
jgi:hypothetical protein